MVDTSEMSISAQEAELRILLDKIRNNSAEASDYHRYEEILNNNSITAQEMTMILRRNGFYSIEQYYHQRSSAITFDEKRRTDGELLGNLLGLGGGLLLFWQRSASQKKQRLDTN